MFTRANHPTLRSWSSFAKRNGQKKKRCGKLVEKYPKRLGAVIAAKGCSTKY